MPIDLPDWLSVRADSLTMGACSGAGGEVKDVAVATGSCPPLQAKPCLATGEACPLRRPIDPPPTGNCPTLPGPA